MTRRLRLAHVITRMCMGGAQENTFQSCLFANKEKFEVELVSGFVSNPEEESIDDKVVAAGIRVNWIKWLRREVSPWHDVLALYELARLFRRKRYDIVHTHTSKAGFLGRLAARMAGVPIVIHTPHGNIFDGYFSPPTTAIFVGLERFAARFTDVLIELTPRGIEEHLARHIGTRGQWRCVFSGIECELYREARQYRSQYRQAWSISDDTVLVGAVGRLEPVKGFEYFVEAARLVLKTVPDVEFVVVGDGSEREVLEAKASGLNRQFRFLGYRDDVPRLMGAFDLLVVPSVNEGMGRVVLEAGAAGLPVVATAVGGIPDILRDGETGILVSPRDPVGLAEAIARLAKDFDLRSCMGRAAQAHVVPRFSVETMVKRLEEIYGDSVDRKNVFA